jgi:protein-S-isoprenylcysteine O-methyltransferase Ste14
MKVDPRLAARYTILEIIRLAVMGVALFWSAGRLDWWAAWAALAVVAGWMIATAVIIFRFTPDLLAERIGPRPGSMSWDDAIMNLLYLFTLLRYITAGLDQRFGWTGGFPLAVQLSGLAVCVLGYTLFTWAAAANPFFSRIVRIQLERGHTVAAGGPYRWLRHPGYLGAIAFELAVAFLLASWPAFLVGLVIGSLLILRTALEDRTLLTELPGYPDYAQRVRWRLLPGVW